MKVIILLLLIFIILAVVGLTLGIKAWRVATTGDDRSRALRRNHAEMARQLERMLIEHNSGSLYLPPGSVQPTKELISKYYKSNH